MANNRMYLRCKKCGSIFYLAKDSGLGYYYVSDFAGLAKDVLKEN